jgi:excisionase family DNA binding protein
VYFKRIAMAVKKYINTTEVVELTGHPYDEILSLAKTGVLPCHRTRRGHYRLNVDAVEEYFGIQTNKPEEVEDKPIREEEAIPPSDTRLITESHYKEVIERICAAKSSIKIMTGDFKRFKLKPTAKQGKAAIEREQSGACSDSAEREQARPKVKNYNDGTPFIKHLMEKAGKGIAVQIICSRPSKSFKEEYDALYEKIKPKNLRIYFCERNHSKVVIVDNKVAYVGSANVTPAGLAQGVMSPGNFEVGFLTENRQFISQLNTLFSKIMNGDYCYGCHLANKCVEY